MIYKEAYEKGIEILMRIHGEGEEGRREAGMESRLLLESVCGTGLQDLLMAPDRVLLEEEERGFLGQLERRSRREPAAYILGDQDFMGLRFAVSPAVLIPRQDTENLVEEALRELTEGARILDLCTGSGCVLLSLLHYSNECTGIGTDLSAQALEIAEKNTEQLGLAGRASFVCGDLFASLKPERQFDLITANPPYIRTGDIDGLQPEVALCEPRGALDGGEDGLLFYRRIAEAAPGYLNIGGVLLMEIGCDQAQDVTRILSDRNYYNVEVYRDYGGHDRVVKAFKGIHTAE